MDKNTGSPVFTPFGHCFKDVDIHFYGFAFSGVWQLAELSSSPSDLPPSTEAQSCSVTAHQMTGDQEPKTVMRGKGPDSGLTPRADTLTLTSLATQARGLEMSARDERTQGSCLCNYLSPSLHQEA